MKAYGIDSMPTHCDVADIHAFGLKSSAGKLRGKGGDIQSNHRNSEVKRQTRRMFKRRARAQGRKECCEAQD